MFDVTAPRHLPPPKGWPARIRSSTVQAISLAHFSLSFARGVAANSLNKIRGCAFRQRWTASARK